MAAVRSLAPRGYVDLIAKAEGRVEVVDGAVYAMAGGKARNGLLEAAIFRFLYCQETASCGPLTSNVAIRFPGESYLFPDAIFACDPTLVDNPITFLENPSVVFEVLSRTTEERDRGRKAELYRSLPSLQAYVLVASDARLVEIYERTELGWTSVLIARPGAEARFGPFAEPLRLDDLYARVTIPEDAASEDQPGNASGA